MNGVASIVTLSSLDKAVAELSGEASEEARQYTDALRDGVVAVLASATNEMELELREDAALEEYCRATFGLVRVIARGGVGFSEVMEAAARGAATSLPRLVRRVGSDLDLYAARAFERTCRIVSDAMSVVTRAHDLDELDVKAVPEEGAAEALTDPILRELLLAQLYAVTVASLAEDPEPMPRICIAMCSRAYRSHTAYTRLALLLDPRESGLTRSRYRPLRNDRYRAAEQRAVNEYFSSTNSESTELAINQALKRDPELID